MTTFNFNHVPTGQSGKVMARNHVAAVKMVREAYGPGDVEIHAV